MADLSQATMFGQLSVQTTCCMQEGIGLVWQVHCDALRRELASQEVTDAREDGIMLVIVPPSTERDSEIGRSSEKDEVLSSRARPLSWAVWENCWGTYVCMYLYTAVDLHFMDIMCTYVCMYLNLGPLTPKQNHASRPTGHPGQEHTVFATYSSEGKMPIHARFTISELLYIY